MAKKHGIPERQVATYEAIAKWPAEAKTYVKDHAEHFRVSELTRQFANRSWRSKATLLAALARHVAGKPPRKRPQSLLQVSSKSPDTLALEDRLRERLKTKVEVAGDGYSGELRISFFSPLQLESILELIER